MMRDVHMVDKILIDPRWYSYSLTGIRKQLSNPSKEYAYFIINTLRNKVKDKINIFLFNKVVYVGLESRRLDYERDKSNGTNKIEKLIDLGYYD